MICLETKQRHLLSLAPMGSALPLTAYGSPFYYLIMIATAWTEAWTMNVPQFQQMERWYLGMSTRRRISNGRYQMSEPLFRKRKWNERNKCPSLYSKSKARGEELDDILFETLSQFGDLGFA